FTIYSKFRESFLLPRLGTDSPYLAPVPNRGKRNDSRNLEYIVNKLADIKNVSPEKVANITFQNGKKLFLK
ncbi:MAG: hypothetical protein GX299_07035, partial [Epulopiscium sp.]|nr:hypothetical protein [Candidatus Epulonipiscium sp.]